MRRNGHLRHGPGSLGPGQDERLSDVVLGRAAGPAWQGSLRGFPLPLSAAARGIVGRSELLWENSPLFELVVLECGRVVDDGPSFQRDGRLGQNSRPV